MRELLIQTAQRTGVIDAEALKRYLDEYAGDKRRIDQLLLSAPNFTEDMVLKLFAAAMGVEYLDEIPGKEIPKLFIETVSATYAQHHYLIGLERPQDNGRITVAVATPLATAIIDNVSKMLGRPVRTALATRAAITAAIDVAYEQKNTVIEEVAEELDQQNLDQLVDEVESSDDLLDVVNRPPVIRLVNDILFRALQMRASDIHIHPYEAKIQVRYRVDGILYDSLSLNRNVLSLIISRIKVMAGMDIAERRMPQDGRCSVRIGQREIDLRVSTVPTSYGERAVLRILDKSTGLLTLEELGFFDEDREVFDKMINYSHGVIFVTGPTGSGKSTTLYACLNRIDSRVKNVMTVEDPIEYQLEGISQMQVSGKKGMTFVNSLRHILRQDPDVIMVGEVRDRETAGMAIQSSLTGHLVFSTLHTNDAAGAISRLLDFGVEPYLVSSSLLCVLAQRLVRRICPDCKQAYEPPPHELRELGIGEISKDVKFHTGAGCGKCFETGYRGRTGIYELMVITEEIRELVYERQTAGAVKKKALEQGMQTLRMDGARKVLAGTTTIAEVLRVTQADWDNCPLTIDDVRLTIGDKRMNSSELKQRTKIFAHRCIRLSMALPKSPVGVHICGQLIRSSTSVAANYRAACRAQSKAGFVSKISIVLEEVDESLFWLEFIVEEKLLPLKRAAMLMKEADELTAIFTTTRKTARVKPIENRKSKIENAKI